MQNSVALQDWLNVIDTEYLSTFIRDGGASVKFVVTPQEQRTEVASRIRALCKQRGYLLLEIDAASSPNPELRPTDAFAATGLRAHMPQDIFFSMARQIDWRRLARARILQLAADRSYKVDSIQADTGGDIFELIGNANGVDGASIIRDIRLDIEETVARNQHMARDFRFAMTHLCRRENEHGGGYPGQPILDWLIGKSQRIGLLRNFSIYTPINRTTARYFIESAFYWIHATGYAGTVVLFDNSRLTVARNPRDGLRHYTRAMMFEHYQILREFIDDADRLAHTLLVIAPDPEFLSSPARSYQEYKALETRVTNDVRDRNRANPIASLVQLFTETQDATA